ncbi:hypothetical protein [Dyella sp. ASV21]|uniref:hypothetical protein n=1 Tax=Dyella sp. ASV21 TaxID=2795114 RepID=UPI0018EA6F22|nr:hypothetical protein [Dyella sp. ASV21]
MCIRDRATIVLEHLATQRLGIHQVAVVRDVFNQTAMSGLRGRIGLCLLYTSDAADDNVRV